MPNTPKAAARTVRIEPGLWAAVRAKAHNHDTTASEVIRRALKRYVRTK